MKMYTLLLFLFSLTSGFSQTLPVVCDPACDWSQANQYTKQIRLLDPDCVVNVTYRSLFCDGVWKFHVDNIEQVEGCNGWGSITNLMEQHRQYSGLLDYITQGLVIQGLTTAGVPVCSTGTFQSNTEVYTASCGIWVYCEYNVDANTAVCPEWDGPLPHYDSPTKVKVWKWQSCGTTCCKRTYRTCKIWDENSQGYYTHIERAGPPVQVGDCTLQSNYSRPCESGCGE